MAAYNAKYNSEEWIGKKYGKLTVIGFEPYGEGSSRSWRWKVKCDCGAVRIMPPWSVISGKNVSCGCFRNSGGHMTNLHHGETHTRLHNIWAGMRDRCRNPNCEFHERYISRGIKVCEEWQCYENFAKWARENGYKDGLSIERIDNDGNYCPENCKWIERPLQARNRGTTYWVEYEGRKMSLAEACEIAKMPYKQVHSRIKYLGWPFEKAISIPMKATMTWKRSERPSKKQDIVVLAT